MRFPEYCGWIGTSAYISCEGHLARRVEVTHRLTQTFVKKRGGGRRMSSYPRMAAFKSAEALRAHARHLGVDLPVDDDILKAPESQMAQPLTVAGRTAGNRCCA